MRINLKQLLLVIFCYINPIVIYWYYVAYRGSSRISFYLPASVLLSGVVLLLINKIFMWRWWKVFSVVIASDFFVAIVLLIFGHLLIGSRFLGFDDLGFYAITAYLGISLFTPIFWVNSFVLITAYYMSKAKPK